MMNKLKNRWLSEKVNLPLIAGDKEISLFQSTRKALLPQDMIDYFKELNGTGGQYDGSIFQFYSLDQIKTVNEEYKDWEGIPNYKNICQTLKEADEYFIFANYSFHLFSYAIRLYPGKVFDNDVLVLCGEEFNKIANSFSEFIQLYLDDSIELQLNKSSG